jgi:hypothetical protein
MERNLGPQPIGELMARHGLAPRDLVAASTEQLTHKMVARAVKGRRLTPRVMGKVLAALEAASGESYELDELFDYAPRPQASGPGGDARPSAEAEGSYACPSCGESIVVPVAPEGRDQEYVEDCPVCCHPVVLRVHFGEDGDVAIAARAE